MQTNQKQLFLLLVCYTESIMSYLSIYAEKQLIGRGHFGRVYLTVHRNSQQTFVAKKIQFQGMTQSEKQKALKEVEIHKKLKHKNIIQFKQFFVENNLLIMIMEYCQFGDLAVYIKKRKQTEESFEQPLIINLFVQMLFGLNYLHDHKILHRDIKTQNIFIDSQGTVKLADFGISKMLQHTHLMASTVVGTPYYLSPEACGSLAYNFKSDIWSLGCVLYELCTLEYPFNGDNILILAKKISSQEPKSIPGRYSVQLSKLIKSILKKNPEQRPTIKQIFSTKYISDYLIKFKMRNQLEQETQGQTYQYPIFQTTSYLERLSSSDNQNQFMDLQYEKGEVKKNQQSKPQSKRQNVKKVEQIQISPQKSRTQNLRRKCIQRMGNELFEKIYQLMRSAQSKNMKQDEIRQIILNKYSKKEFQMSMDIAQLLYLEQIQKK